MPTSIPLGQLVKVAIRDIWTNEASDFTPWLAEPDNIQLLGNAIGIELEVEVTEKEVGPFQADILCKDTATGNWVLVENQLEKTDHTHLGQLITYAAGLKSTTIVWVASRFTDEHRAAIDWLNEITSGDFNFFGLEVEVWRIGESATAPKFNIVCAPNNWAQKVAQGTRQIELGELSPVQKLQLEFWTGFREYVLDNSSTLKATKAHPQTWMTFAVGRSGFTIMACIATQDPDSSNPSGHQIRVEFVAIDDLNKSYFNQLAIDQSAIEAEFGGPLVWAPSPGIKQSKVFVKSSASLNDRENWPVYFAWLLQNLEKFRVIFSKRVKLLNSAPSEAEAE